MASSKKSQSNNDQVAALLEAWVKPGQRLVLGLSGGVDSVALLHMLVQLQASLRFTLSAVHVNHQISPNASSWAVFCQQLCAAYKIPFETVAVTLNRQAGESLEAIARDARYQVFSSCKADFVVLGQHLDDQAETVMLQLLRGAGAKGLSAMPQARDAESGAPILRPLLHIARSEIESYATAHQLQWIHDESNDNISFDRNFLRHKIFPVLEKRFSAYRLTLLRVSQNLAEASDLMDELAAMDAQQAMLDGRLQLGPVRQLSHIRAKNLLRYFLAKQGVSTPSAERLDELLRQLLSAAIDAKVHMVLGNHEIRRFQDQVYILAKSHMIMQDLQWTWQGEPAMKLDELKGMLHFEKATGQGISLEKLQSAPVTVRLRQGGERFRPNCSRPTLSLKHLFQELQVPPWHRQALPLLYSGNTLVWVAGIGIDCHFQAKADEAGVFVNWLD